MVGAYLGGVAHEANAATQFRAVIPLGALSMCEQAVDGR